MNLQTFVKMIDKDAFAFPKHTTSCPQCNETQAARLGRELVSVKFVLILKFILAMCNLNVYFNVFYQLDKRNLD